MLKTDLIFATHNKKKAEEIAQILPPQFHLKTLTEIGFYSEIEETSSTLEGNALIKSKTVFDRYGLAVFSDDTGLEVDALQGEPGVFSARYAGNEKNSEKNMTLLLQKLRPHKNRNAQFRTVISLIYQEEKHFFEGIVKGHIAHERLGSLGFGYDPVFIPDGYTVSFAEMSSEEKNKISHRGRAIQKMLSFLHSVV